MKILIWGLFIKLHKINNINNLVGAFEVFKVFKTLKNLVFKPNSTALDVMRYKLLF